MPIYEYACSKCGKAFEQLLIHKADEGDVRCPQCGSAKLARKMSRPANSRKGEGGLKAGPGCGSGGG